MKAQKQTAKRERPIIFSGEMVRKILSGEKTQTRRVIKNPTNIREFFFIDEKQAYPFYYRRSDGVWDSFKTVQDLTAKRCPYGKVGDLLWVRETWAKDSSMLNGVRYYATDDVHELRKKRPSIFMPRWASRITLEITNIRVERLQDISEADAISEGIEKHNGLPPPKECGYLKNSVEVDRFARLWDSINQKRGFGWETNPFVWVIEFKKL